MTRRIGLAAAFVLLLAAGLCAAGHPATVHTVDGQRLVGNVMDDAFAVRTSYGTVTVPAQDIAAVYPGVLLGDATRKRIDQTIQKLTGANKDQAARDLTAMGRITVPQLQAAAEGSDKKLAKEASAVLKGIWPSGARVPSDGGGILLTRTMEFRGTLTFSTLRVEGAFGKKTLLPLAVRLVQFRGGRVQPAGDPPVYPPPKSPKAPEFDLTMNDSSRIVGTLDVFSLDVETPYGKLAVPVRDVISIRLGDPDEIITRDMTFQGKLATAALTVQSKIGAFRLDRDKVLLVKTVLDETGTAAVPVGEVKLNQWTDLFNGKDLSNWSGWGSGTRKVEDEAIRLTGDSGLGYQPPQDVKNCIVAAQVKINSLTGPGGGVKITVRDGEEGTYYVNFNGKNGVIAKWDNKSKTSVTLKNFQADPAPDGWHSVQFGIVETMMLAYINGKSVCEITVDPKDQLPAGRICIGTWNCDASFRQVQLKMLK